MNSALPSVEALSTTITLIAGMKRHRLNDRRKILLEEIAAVPVRNDHRSAHVLGRVAGERRLRPAMRPERIRKRYSRHRDQNQQRRQNDQRWIKRGSPGPCASTSELRSQLKALPSFIQREARSHRNLCLRPFQLTLNRQRPVCALDDCCFGGIEKPVSSAHPTLEVLCPRCSRLELPSSSSTRAWYSDATRAPSRCCVCQFLLKLQNAGAVLSYFAVQLLRPFIAGRNSRV